MAGTVTTKRITDDPNNRGHNFTRCNAASGGVPVSSYFDATKLYSNSWQPSEQQTTSFRSGRAFLRAKAENPGQNVLDEDLTDSEIPDNSDLLMKMERNQAVNDQVFSHDRGHPFSTIKVMRDPLTIVDLRSSDGKISYRGPMGLTVSGSLAANGLGGGINPSGYPNILPPGAIPDIDQTYGTKAISKTIPTLPVSGVAQFLGELHEGLPRMIGNSGLFRDRAHAFQNLGGEYLNVVFGWKPFVRDLKDFASAFQNAGKILKQYRRDSGKVVHRHWAFPPIRDASVYPSYQMGYGLLSPAQVLRIPSSNSVYGNWQAGELESLQRIGTSVLVSASSVRKQRYWFSGAYSYLLSEDDSFLGRMEGYMQKANKLLGVRITPEVLWELTPWSWLADWELNIGVNITNATALGQDSLVLRYGYLMRETSYNHYTSTSNFQSYGSWSGPIHQTWRIVKKERIRSTPYGFGLNPASFTDSQWAILGALGMTKAPRSLH